MSGNTTALTLKHFNQFQAGDWLCIEPSGAELVQRLTSLGNCAVLCSDSRETLPNQLASFEERVFDHVLMVLPKGKALRDMYLDYVRATLKPSGTLWLVGDIKLGAKSAAKVLTESIGTTKKIDSAKHCVIYQSMMEKPQRFDADDYLLSWQTSVANQALTLCSQPGVYGHGKVDEGSDLLLKSLPEISGKVVDVGCGGGLISAWLLKQYPSLEVTACDISTLAVAATEKTLAVNKLQATVLTSDVFSNIKGRYDTIISNPPFHDGFDTSYGAVHRLISEAPYHLVIGGKLILVANRHLKYGDWLDEHFGSFDVLAETNRFKVYQAINKV